MYHCRCSFVHLNVTLSRKMYRVKIEMTRIQNHIITAITQGSRDIMYYIV